MDKFYTAVQGTLIGIATAIAAYFDSTFSFVCALILAFLFNILAGFRADEVKIKLHRIFPPIVAFEKFNGNKFKDSLLELVLIASTTYLLKGLIDLMDYDAQSTYVVQWLFVIAIYVYFRNGLRNLHESYKNVVFIRILYAILAFKFREIFGDKVSDIIENEEKNENTKSKKNSPKR